MRILVVEDNDRVAHFLEKGLSEEGYAVDRLSRGSEVLPAVEAYPYDLILLDVMLPERNGFVITRDLRERGATVPILLLTAKNEIGDRVEGLDAGADDYLPKPFAFAELLARVRALLRRAEPSRETLLTISDLSLEPATRRVTRGGEEIELTAKEFALLEFLLRNKGKVLTRTSITEHVWDMNFDSGTNVVDVYIRYLRKKIDDEFPLKLIHTIRGVGYVLREPR